jgi:hypothetical protein
VSKVQPATIEEIEGSDFKRVLLTEKAAERIGIQTELVRDEQVLRKHRIGGRVLGLPAGRGGLPATGSDSSAADDLSKVMVQVRLNKSDLSKVDPSQPARVLRIGEAEDQASTMAEPYDATEADLSVESNSGDVLALYFVVDNTELSLAYGQGVLVELAQSETATQRLIVPYAAVVYGLQGETWVYTNPEPLVFIRQSIVIDYIEGDLAILSEGPLSGTQVVVVGVAELYGAETGVSK